MIGLVFRAMGFGGLPGAGCCAVVAGVAVAICALCGINKCMKFRMRDCACIKRWMRASGTDKFDDFDLIINVHEALYTSTSKSKYVSKLTTAVRVTAGAQTVKTDESSKGIFQQMLQVFIEQGTEYVLVELLDARERKVAGYLKLDIMRDILSAKEPITEKMYNMKQKSKGVLNPRIKLSVMMHNDNDMEQGLLAGIGGGTGSETSLMLRQHLQKSMAAHKTLAASDEDVKGPSSELEILAKGCCGPVEVFGAWGTKEQRFISIKGPPDMKKYTLCVYKDKLEADKSGKISKEINLLKVMSVQPDPGRNEVFMIQYLDEDKVKQRLQCRRLDRARDVWVEMLQLLIKQIHARKQQAKDKQHAAVGKEKTKR